MGFGSAIWGSLDSENTGAGVKVFIVAALGLFGGGMGLLLGKESAGLINIPVLGGLSGFALGSIGGSIIEKSFWGRKSKKCLNSQKKIYQDRINELGGKLDEISEAISILTKDPDKSERQEKRIKTLQMKADAVEELKQRYLINIKKMDLIRWGWGLQRLTTLLDNIDYEQCKERLTLLKELKSDGKELESTWLGDSLMSSLPDGEYNVKMLEDGLNSCDSWLDELKDKLAELAAGTISKLTPIETVKGSKSAWDEFNNFIQISRSSVLFSAQDELDNEYQRLKLDEDSSKELEGL
ncbi:MAG: hypothetical protein GY757_54655 [bacterium]|nr:hypothetical protein [bacterium]